MQERLEQDLLLRAETDHAVNGPQPFKAKPIPKSTLEPRYAFLQEAALFRREQNVKQRKAQIESQVLWSPSLAKGGTRGGERWRMLCS